MRRGRRGVGEHQTRKSDRTGSEAGDAKRFCKNKDCERTNRVACDISAKIGDVRTYTPDRDVEFSRNYRQYLHRAGQRDPFVAQAQWRERAALSSWDHNMQARGRSFQLCRQT